MKPRPLHLNRRRFLHGLAAVPFLNTLRAAEEFAAPAPPALVDPARGPGAGWTMVVFPDTQNYAKYAKNQAHFDRITRWVRDHRKAWNIRLALHEGDLVEQNNIATGGGRGFGDQNSESQWASARRALLPLANELPVIHTTGNHDYGERNAETRATQFNDYFPANYNPGAAALRIEAAPNAAGQRTLENAAYEFKAPDGRKVLILSLEWGPRRDIVEWAARLVRREAYRSHTGLLLVHDFVTPENLRDGQDGNRKRPGNPHTYATGKAGDTHDGEDLWQALVRGAPQVELVLNGHEMAAHVGYRADRSDAGRTVHQMLFNAQGLGGGSDHRGNGGDGWLRLLTFEPDGRTLSVRTFSPLRLDRGDAAYWDHPRWRFAVQLHGA
ncbi:MAG: hypothetical protein RJA22_236 [Verrucomicrobiota bacterium]